jgi:hypothetical protein
VKIPNRPAAVKLIFNYFHRRLPLCRLYRRLSPIAAFVGFSALNADFFKKSAFEGRLRSLQGPLWAVHHGKA